MGGRGGGSGWRVGGQGGCERGSEDFVKIQKKWGVGGSGAGSGAGGSDQGLGWGRGGSKVCGRW